MTHVAPDPRANHHSSPARRAARPLDVVVWGATGYTGKLVAEYLTRRYGVAGSVRWAIGGRSRERLEQARADLAAIDPKAAGLPVLVGDNRDRASLDAVVRETRVMATTVGPYSLYGRELVAACVDAATDYCDITGEAPFIRDMIDLHHDRAARTGARIVPSCGFDSIPSDVGTWMLEERAREDFGAPCTAVRLVMRMRGGLSGGTAASMALLFEQAAGDRRIRRLLADPYALDPARSWGGGQARGGAIDFDLRGVHWDGDLRSWTGPFLMAAINARVVRRTNALLGYAWGKDFRYSEATGFGSGPRGLLAAAGMSAGLALGGGAMAVAPLRRLLVRRAPSPGQGPSREARARGFFVASLVGTGGAEGDPVKVLATVSGADPGYGETAKMLAESALALATSEAPPARGGVLTPASCMGMDLVRRLRQAGIAFDVNKTFHESAASSA